MPRPAPLIIDAEHPLLVRKLGDRLYGITYSTVADDGNPTTHDGASEPPVKVPKGEAIEAYLGEWLRAALTERAAINSKAQGRMSPRSRIKAWRRGQRTEIEAADEDLQAALYPDLPKFTEYAIGQLHEVLTAPTGEGLRAFLDSLSAEDQVGTMRALRASWDALRAEAYRLRDVARETIEAEIDRRQATTMVVPEGWDEAQDSPSMADRLANTLTKGKR